MASSLWSLKTPSGVRDITTFRKFHAIAALGGDGLRPELQTLFERLAVDPHSGLFIRDDGMVQSGPDPISARAPIPQITGETRTLADNISHIVLRKKLQVAN